jgi:hypothetical protein
MVVTRWISILIAAVTAALGWMSPTAAHHSHGNYIRSDWTYLQGTVRQIHWMNPHSWIYLEVQDTDGEAQIWALEGASVVTLRRDGWTQDSVRVGDALSVRCNPLKDGSRGCLLGFILSDDGEEKEFD